MVSLLRSSRMTWSLILLLLLSGLPQKSVSATEPSAKECRVHIEKALDQYFDTSDQDPITETQIEEPPILEDDDDDSHDVSELENENPSDDEVDDDDDDDDDDDADHQQDDQPTVPTNETREPDVQDDLKDQDDDEEEEDDTPLTADQMNIDDDDNDDDDDDEEEDELDEKKKSVFAKRPIIARIYHKPEPPGENVQPKQRDVAHAEDDDGDDDDDNVDDDEGQLNKVEELMPLHDKVTGDADSAASRVVPKLSPILPKVEQPKTETTQQEKADLNKTPLPDPAKLKQPEKPEAVTTVTFEDDDDDDALENIYEDDDDDDDDYSLGAKFRSRVHIDAILGLDEIGTDYDIGEDKLAQSIFREIKKIHATNIRPMEIMYKFTESTSRLLGDAEIFSKPMVLFLGPWSTGKSTIINYLLGTERTPSALKTGSGFAGVDFTVLSYGDKRQTISGTELAADWKYASLQKFGQRFLDHLKGVTMPHTLLKKITLIDTPGILENRKNAERGYNFNDAFQWFVDRADAIYVALDPTKVDIGSELGAVIDQLKGRDIRFILNKADSIRRSELMRVVGQLFWNLSPLMCSTEVPVIYAVSLTTKPYNPSAPAKFLTDQENNFLYDLKETMGKRVENRILYARRHAVRVRNHAKMVDCYLSTYYRHKSIFSSKKNVAKLITENPLEYHIYEGISSMSNVSRYDLPDASIYKNFFKQYPLYDFKALASTCSYFRGCPMEKLDNAIAKELPELFTKYKKLKFDEPSQTTAKQDDR